MRGSWRVDLWMGVLAACTTGWAIDASALRAALQRFEPRQRRLDARGQWVRRHLYQSAGAGIGDRHGQRDRPLDQYARAHECRRRRRADGLGRRAAAAADYAHTFDLPAGTHLVRTEYANDRDASAWATVNSLNVNGATISNSSTSDQRASGRRDLHAELSQGRRRGAASYELVRALSLPSG